ncbi:unnamed protein product, partial [Coregonus sp. 'balchen']
VTQTELERLKVSYRQLVRDAVQAKRKYQETSKEFDSGLLEDSDRLKAGELELNELTVEGIQHRLTAVEEELLSLAGTVSSQQASVNQLELELEAEEEGIKRGQRDTMLPVVEIISVPCFCFIVLSPERDGLRNLSVDGIISHLSGLFKPKYT